MSRNVEDQPIKRNSLFKLEDVAIEEAELTKEKPDDGLHFIHYLAEEE